MTTCNVGEKIGSGGFVGVFNAIREENDWSCALKRLHTSAGKEERTRFS